MRGEASPAVAHRLRFSADATHSEASQCEADNAVTEAAQEEYRNKETFIGDNNMKVRLRGKVYTCGSARIVPLHEDGRKRIILDDTTGVNSGDLGGETKVVGDLTLDEVVVIIA